jgi:hippurate hydrolase
VDRRYRVGQVVAQPGSLAAAADTFCIELLGSACHAARPHEGLDPTPGAGALIEGLHSIVSRRLKPGTPAVVSIGIVRAGTASNIIPDKVRLEGTLRSMDPETRTLLKLEVQRRAESIAKAHGLEARVSFGVGLPAVVNEAEPTEWARQAVVSVLGDDALATLDSINMAGEDFACYLEKMTGCFLRIGAREDGGEFIPLHTPRFVAADESIFVGSAVLAETARVSSHNL